MRYKNTKTQLFFGIFVLTMSWGCSDKATPVEVEQQNDLNFARLLARYKQVSIDTLKVHYNSGDDEKSSYHGTVLDSLDLSLLPRDLRPDGDFYGFFACSRFAIDSNRTALITRTPSMYESSAINVLVYDRLADSISYQFEIAEEWGDAGASFKKTSWIFRENGAPRVFTLEDYSYDRSVEDPNDTTVETKTTSYLLKLGMHRIDTVIKNDKVLERKFN